MQQWPKVVEQPFTSLKGSPLILIGGAEDKEREKSILRAFIEQAGGRAARVLVLPAASSMPEILAEVYRMLFVQMGATVEVLQVGSRYEAELERSLAQVEASTALFMTGGDQVRLCNLIAGTTLAQRLRERWAAGGLVLAGTSAGASAMGECMIARGYSGETPKRNIVELSEGLGILKDIIVDQHFHNRNRLTRLMTAVASRPHCLGIGVDENTAGILDADGVLKVLGEGTVTIVDGSELLYNTINDTQAYQPFSVGNFRISVLAAGLRFHLRERKVL